jgi:class 3 adenylate cyclase/tetratricopeptide (TPR) repeat protein
VQCGECGFGNPGAARYCAGCGRVLETRCSSCGSELPDGARYCPACGQTVGDDPPAATEAANSVPLGGMERRRVSILFVDLEEWTRLTSSLDPEEARTIQSRYFETARSVVATFDGTIEKFIGDAVMAVWGAPRAHEDDAERAVRAALEIVRQVRLLGGAAANTSLRARAAVTTGEAAVAIGSQDRGIVTGDVVNSASRLQSMAQTDHVLVDRATREMVGDALEFEAVGDLALRGRPATVETYRALPAPRGDTGRRVHAGAFVGRERELRELIDLFDGVALNRRCRLVSVTGVAGIGKSRLGVELARHIDAQPQDVAWHAGRVPAWGEDITFRAVADMVRHRIRAADGASSGVATRQLAAALLELVRDPEERAWLEPRVGVLIDPAGTNTFDRDELFAAWRRFFEHVAERTPAVLVFEDLQWADAGLLEFVEHVASWGRDRPILVLALARPELLDHRPTWGAGAARFTSLHLDPLADDAMEQILADRAPGLPRGVVRQVVERAGGIPLYAVEVARALDVTGASQAPGGAVSIDPGVGMPESLHAVIGARIDALLDVDRRVLMAAAVLGRRFRPADLMAVLAIDAASTRTAIERLINRELLAPEGRGSGGTGEIAFVQDLVREVAAGMLTREERRALHLQAARYLDGRAPEEGLAESRARHLIEAHRLAPTHSDAPRIARRAVAALREAARDAMRLHTPDRALGFLDEALGLEAAAAQRAELLEQAATAASAAARLDVAEARLRDLVKLRTGTADRPGAARARARLAGVLLLEQRNDAAVTELEAALRAMRRPAADAAGVELVAQLARAHMLRGDHRASLEWADRALRAAQRLGLAAVAIDVRITRGTARFQAGDQAGGMDEVNAAIADAVSAGIVRAELRGRNNLAWLVALDDPRLTFRTAEAGFERATEIGLGDYAVQMAELSCAVAVDTGDWEWALATVAELVDRPIPDAFRITLVATAAALHALRGEPSPMGELERVLPLSSDSDRQVAAAVEMAQAWIALLRGSAAEARALAARSAEGSFGPERWRAVLLAGRASLWLGEGTGASTAAERLAAARPSGRVTAAAAMTIRAGVQALEGDGDAAATYREAASEWRALELPLQLALCLLEMRRFLDGESRSGADAEAEADRLIARLGAGGLRELVDGDGISPG